MKRLPPLSVCALLVVSLLCSAPASADHNYMVDSSGLSSALFGDLSSNTTETLTVKGAGTELTFDSVWNNGTSSSKTKWQLENGAKITVTADAMVNDNMPDLVNARPFSVTGSGTIEFQVGFDADHTGYVDGMAAADHVTWWGGNGDWTNSGFSTINLGGDVTMITNASRNLTTIHKLGWETGSGNVATHDPTGVVHTHHGLITISEGDGARWIVQGEHQVYDAGINWSNDWTLETQTDLTVTGAYEPKAKIAFGTRGTDPAKLTKTGPANLNISLHQQYNPGTEIEVAEGAVNFLSDTSDYGTWYPTWHWPTKYADADGGKTLFLDVLADGTAGFFDISYGLKALSSAGALEVMLGAADLGWTKITILESLAQGGTLEIVDDGTMTVGTYDLFDAATFSGDFDVILPQDYAGNYEPTTGELTVTAVPEPTTIALLALAGVAMVRRRR